MFKIYRTKPIFTTFQPLQHIKRRLKWGQSSECTALIEPTTVSSICVVFLNWIFRLGHWGPKTRGVVFPFVWKWCWNQNQKTLLVSGLGRGQVGWRTLIPKDVLLAFIKSLKGLGSSHPLKVNLSRNLAGGPEKEGNFCDIATLLFSVWPFLSLANWVWKRFLLPVWMFNRVTWDVANKRRSFFFSTVLGFIEGVGGTYKFETLYNVQEELIFEHQCTGEPKNTPKREAESQQLK